MNPTRPSTASSAAIEFSDNARHHHGQHTFKFGADANLIQLRSKKQQIFQLDFGGDVNFGGIPRLLPGVALPGVSNPQAYGLGIPQTYIQGIGSSNTPLTIFLSGSSLRTPGAPPASSPSTTASVTTSKSVRCLRPPPPLTPPPKKQFGVVEGIPRDYNNVAPRIGLAWDPKGDGKTVVRVGYGLFYDHPLLAIAFDSTTADGGRSVQLLSIGGTPSACGIVSPLPKLPRATTPVVAT